MCDNLILVTVYVPSTAWGAMLLTRGWERQRCGFVIYFRAASHSIPLEL
jgi:hypothetical protein